MRISTKRIVFSALLAALTCVATVIINIPSPLKGYLNLGDCVVLLSGWILTPVYGFLAAGIGSALADLFLGYTVYVPATFVIKGMMAVLSHGVFLLCVKKTHGFIARLVSGIAAEALMICGYFVFEGFLYGFAASSVNIPANAVQGAAGLILGLPLMRLLEKSRALQLSEIR